MRAPGGSERRDISKGGFPPIPAETARKYPKRSPLTVLFRQQVQTISPCDGKESNRARVRHLGVRVWKHACGFANHPHRARALGRLAIGPEASGGPVGECNRWPRSTTSTPVLCQRLLKTIQHGLRFHTPSEPKAHCGLSQWRQTAWVGRASTGDHQHSWEVPMACT